MKWIGAHVSAEGGVWRAAERAGALGATAFGVFTKNQKRRQAKGLTAEDRSAFAEALAAGGFTPDRVLAHDSYLINLGHPDAAKRSRSFHAFVDEMRRCAQLGIPRLNFHPGAHLKKTDEDTCLRAIAAGLREALAAVEGVTLVVEATAGQGSSVGYRFEHLASLLEYVDRPARLGVCLDTCHIFAAGYDLRTPAACEATFAAFDRLVGREFLQALHLNDAKKPLGSRVDRHACLGEGEIGLAGFRWIMRSPRFERMPLIMETPEPERWGEELVLLRSLEKGGRNGETR